MTLHNALSVATPSQRLAAAAHNERLSRINGAAIDRRAAEVAKVDEAQVEILEDDWAARQFAINPLPKEPWFSIVSETEAPRPSVESIQRKVAKYYGTTRHEMLSERRVRRLVIPRHVAMYFCRQLTFRSYPEIGRRFGNRDHTVPIYACNKIERLMQEDPKMAADIEAIKILLDSAS